MSLDIVDLLVFVSALTTPKTQEAYFGGDIVMNILIVHSPQAQKENMDSMGISMGYSSCSTGSL